MRFKRDIGILPAENGPGLPLDNKAWNVAQGGSGFAPPYCFPKAPMAPMSSSGKEGDNAESGSSGKELEIEGYPEAQHTVMPSTANKYLRSFTTRYAKPATVFCSRELENGLMDYVRTVCVEGGKPFPEDGVLRAKACEILKLGAEQGTPADDTELLGKFKDMVRAKLAEEQGLKEVSHLPAVSEGTDMSFAETSALAMGNMDVDLNLQLMTEDVDSIFRDMNFAFDDGAEFLGQ